MWRVRIALFIIVSVAALGALVATIAWGIDERGNADVVAANVTFAGRPIGRLGGPRLRTAINEIATEYGKAHLVVGEEGRGFEIPALDIGLVLTVDRAERSALRTGRTGSLPKRVAGWARSFIAPRTAAVPVAYDPSALRASVSRLDPGPRVEPREPNLTATEEGLLGTEGKNGQGIDAADVADALPAAVRAGLPLLIDVEAGPITPRFSDGAADRLAEAVERQVVRPLSVRFGSTTKEIGAEALRPWLQGRPGLSALELAVEQPAIDADLERLLPDVGTAPVEPQWTVSNNRPMVAAGRNGSVCCDAESSRRVAGALMKRFVTSPAAADSDASTPVSPPLTTAVGPPEPPVELVLRPAFPLTTADEIPRLGIVEQVGTFTTQHAGGQPRVRNIHRIADLVRGTIIKPGETLSLNKLIGPRTEAKGFVTDGVIIDGKFDRGVGGGISQFATTLFNSAFFAGLDFGEYQSHTIYINRYPYGREATISFPHPDLQLRNTTPYGVLVWPTYSETSITVTLYSTDQLDAEQTNQSTQPVGACTRVNTERTRRYEDGRTAVDSVSSLYQPAEGVRC